MKKIEQKGKVSFGQAVKDFCKGYFDFSGTTTRAGYWWVILAIAIVYLILGILTSFTMSPGYYGEPTPNLFMVLLVILFSLALIVPALALSVRRFRDTGLKSKTILVVYILYYALYGTLMVTVYASVLNSISSMFSAYYSMMGDSASPMNTTLNLSPTFIFLYGVVALFMALCLVLPTGMFATKSNHPVLTSIFAKESSVK